MSSLTQQPVKVIVRDGEMIVTIKLDLNINLNNNEIGVKIDSEKEKEINENAWAIPDFKNAGKVKFGKE